MNMIHGLEVNWSSFVFWWAPKD